MYVNLAKADKEIQRMKRREEMPKDKIAEAQEAIWEKNALLLQKAALAREMEELKEKMASAEQKKVEEIAAARAEAVELFWTSEELTNFILDRLVDEQIHWKETLVTFNLSLEINLDMSGVPPSISPAANATC